MLVNLLLVLKRTLAFYFSRFFERIFKRERIIETLAEEQLMSTSKATPVNEDVAYANYSLFQKRSTRARESLKKAVDADETSLLFLII